MNIYDVLSRDHREFERLLDRLLAASKAGDDSWKTTLDQLRQGVVAHSHAEEAVLYNALREADQAKGLVMHSYAEHAKADTEMRALGAAKVIDRTWTSMVEKLRDDLRHHIQEEETKVFAAARQIFTEQEAEQIGVAFERLKALKIEQGDSMVKSHIDLIANLLPPRLTGSFRKNVAVSPR
jgi:hemerythrin superfamily protein